MNQILARAALAATLCVFLMPALATAETSYLQPSSDLVDVIDAPATPWVNISPDEKSIMLMHRPNLPPISELAEEELRLAGTRIKPATNGPSRGWSANGLTPPGRRRPAAS